LLSPTGHWPRHGQRHKDWVLNHLGRWVPLSPEVSRDDMNPGTRALITILNPESAQGTQRGGMKLEGNKWVGNEEAVKDFPNDIDGFLPEYVEPFFAEYAIDDKMCDLFKQQQEEHKAFIGLWTSNEQNEQLFRFDGMHNMSIMRCVEQAKRWKANPETTSAENMGESDEPRNLSLTVSDFSDDSRIEALDFEETDEDLATKLLKKLENSKEEDDDSGDELADFSIGTDDSGDKTNEASGSDITDDEESPTLSEAQTASPAEPAHPDDEKDDKILTSPDELDDDCWDDIEIDKPLVLPQSRVSPPAERMEASAVDESWDDDFDLPSDNLFKRRK